MSGTLRAVLWFLSSLGVLWLLLGIFLLPGMGRMMGGGGMMESETMPMMDGMMGMGPMMILMVVQLLAMLGLLGIFIYLVLDSLRGRPPPADR